MLGRTRLRCFGNEGENFRGRGLDLYNNDLGWTPGAGPGRIDHAVSTRHEEPIIDNV